MSTRWRLEAGSVGSSQGLQPRGWKHGAGRGVAPRVQKCDGHPAEGGPNRQAGMLATPDALTHDPSVAPHTCPIPALSLALFSPSPAREGSRKTAHPIGPQSSVCHSDWSRRLTPPSPRPPGGRLGHTIKDKGGGTRVNVSASVWGCVVLCLILAATVPSKSELSY